MSEGQMERLRFAHAADLHIDSPFRGLMESNPVIAERLREATHIAFRNLIKLCIDEKVDFLVVAGDVYDGADRTPRSQIRFRDGLAELAQAGIGSFVVHGNHDPLDGQFSSITWPDKVHIFGDNPSWQTATRNGEPIADIQGVSYRRRVVTDNLALQFSPPRDSDLFTVGILHCNVGGMTGHDNYAPCTIADLSSVGLDYWALGHIHTRQTLKEERPAIVYPGNTQGRDPNESGSHGCILVDVSPDGSTHMEFRELDVVRWESIELSIDNIGGIDAFYDRMSAGLDNLRNEGGGRDIICRLRITGRGPLHDELKRAGSLDGLLEDIRSSQFSDSPWVWVERAINQTRPDLDLVSRSGQDDFLGSVLKRAAEAETKDFIDALSEVFSEGRDGLLLPDEDEIKGLIMEAEWLLAERLEPKD